MESVKDKAEEKQVTREELLHQKSRIDDKLIKLERQRSNDKIVDALRKLHELNDSISDMQNALNSVWKRLQQIEEDLKEAFYS